MTFGNNVPELVCIVRLFDSFKRLYLMWLSALQLHDCGSSIANYCCTFTHARDVIVGVRA
jgi:hypothetical protein